MFTYIFGYSCIQISSHIHTYIHTTINLPSEQQNLTNQLAETLVRETATLASSIESVQVPIQRLHSSVDKMKDDIAEEQLKWHHAMEENKFVLEQVAQNVAACQAQVSTNEQLVKTIQHQTISTQNQLHDDLSTLKSLVETRLSQEALRTESMYTSFIEKQEKFARLMATTSIQNMSISSIKRETYRCAEKFAEELLVVENQMPTSSSSTNLLHNPEAKLHRSQTTQLTKKQLLMVIPERLQNILIKDCPFVADLILARAEYDALRSGRIHIFIYSYFLHIFISQIPIFIYLHIPIFIYSHIFPYLGFSHGNAADSDSNPLMHILLEQQLVYTEEFFQKLMKYLREKSSDQYNDELLKRREVYLYYIKNILLQAIDRRILPLALLFDQENLASNHQAKKQPAPSTLVPACVTCKRPNMKHLMRTNSSNVLDVRKIHPSGKKGNNNKPLQPDIASILPATNNRQIINPMREQVPFTPPLIHSASSPVLLPQKDDK